MGSGCSNSSNGINLFGSLTSDKKVQYTGVPVPGLGICTGDFLNEVEAVILQKLVDFSSGIGINLPNIDLTVCDLFKTYITCCDTACTDLPCLMNIVIQSLCVLYGDFNTLNSEITTLLAGPYNTSCLTLGTNPTLTNIIQELLIEFCALKAQVSALSTTVTNLSAGITTTIGNFLNTSLQSCQKSGLVKTGTGSSFLATFKGFVPIGAILEYHGPTAGLFDGTGLGITGTDACGWALSNGNNGTRDKRGFVGVGAINGMGGGSLDSHVVDAGASPSAVYSPEDVVGEIRHQLVSAEIPSMGVTISDPGHYHGFVGRQDRYKFGQDQFAINAIENTSSAGSGLFLTTVIAPSFTGITASLAGGSGKHENRQPSKASLYIERIS